MAAIVKANVRYGLYLWVAAGGALGSIVRFLVSLGWLAWGEGDFPWPTLLVNVLGSMLIGFIAAVSTEGGRWPLEPEYQVFLMAGFCGGLTTFSFVSLELGLMLQAEQWLGAIIYLAISLVGWLCAVWLGFRAGIQTSFT